MRRHFFDEVLHQPPSELLERLTPWLLATFTIGVALLMAYSWWMARR